MILFMLICIPVIYALILTGANATELGSRTVRNPLIGGALAFVAYLALEFFFGSGYPPDLQVGPAWRFFSVEALLLPSAWALLVFAVLFHRLVTGPRAGLLLAARSFLAGFFGVLAIQDLIMAINFLTPTDLFYLPVVRAVWLILVSQWLSEWRSPLRRHFVLAAVMLAVQILSGFALTFAWLGQHVPALACLLPPLVLAVVVLSFSRRLSSEHGVSASA